MVLSDAPSAFSRKSKLPLSSTTQMVTCTFRFLASASAAATIVLMVARSRYFLLGRSVAGIAEKKLNMTKSSLNMGEMLPIAPPICQMKGNGIRKEWCAQGDDLRTFLVAFVAALPGSE